MITQHAKYERRATPTLPSQPGGRSRGVAVEEGKKQINAFEVMIHDLQLKMHEDEFATPPCANSSSGSHTLTREEDTQREITGEEASVEDDQRFHRK